MVEKGVIKMSMRMCVVMAVLVIMVTTGHVTATYDKDQVVEKALTYLKDHRDVQEKDMKEYIAIPSVAAESKMDSESRRAAEWLAEWLQTRLGMTDAKLYESGYRHPTVIASTGDLSKPGVVVYGHYDVQPADGEWTISGPFEAKKLTIDGYGDVLTGRGASDCKGQQYLALSALEALDKSLPGGLSSLPINIIVCVEGEEEIGSPGFGHVLKAHSDLFTNAQFVLSTDAINEDDIGQVLLSTRGALGVQIDVFGAFADLPSGLYGGSFLNPIVAATHIVASLHDAQTKRVLLKGFYDNVEDLADWEVAEMPVVDDEAEAKYLGITKMTGEVGYTTMERKTVRPTLELIGFYSGFQGEGTKTIIPAEAHAKIVFRLVAGQDPEAVYTSLQDHIASVAPSLAEGLRVEVKRFGPGARAYQVRYRIYVCVCRQLKSLPLANSYTKYFRDQYD